MLARGQVLAEGDYADVSQQPRRDRRLSRHEPYLSAGDADERLRPATGSRCWRCASSKPGTAKATSCTASSSTSGAGEVVTLLGRNGAGKTTTLSAIMGLVGRRAGSIRFDGTETISMRSDQIARAGIGYCPEERGIFASLT